MIIAITGTPGCGKTTLAKKIVACGFVLLDLSKFVKEKKIHLGFDEQTQSYLVDEKILAKKIVEKLKSIKLAKNSKVEKLKLEKLLKTKLLSKKSTLTKLPDVVIDGHMSHYVPKKYVDLVVVVRAPINVLNARLQKRKYHSQKIMENVQAEIFDVCGCEAKEAGHNVVYFN